MPGGRVAEGAGEIRHHRLEDTWIEPRGGVIVHVDDAVGHVPMIVATHGPVKGTSPQYNRGAVETPGTGAGRGEVDRLVGEWEDVARQLNEAIHAQERKLLEFARNLHPGLTPEDVRNPHDFEEVARSPEFSYEDGILAGLLSARSLLLRELARVRTERSPGPGAT